MEPPKYHLFHRRRVEKKYARLFAAIGLGLTTWSPLASQCPMPPAPESKKPIAMDGLGAIWALWSGKRGSNSRPTPWQGIALPTELFLRMHQRKTHHEDGFINLVARGGIEPPTQGFSMDILV